MYDLTIDEIEDAIIDALENVGIHFLDVYPANNSMWHDGPYYSVELDLDKPNPFSGPRSAEKALQEELDFNFNRTNYRAKASYVGEEEIQIYVETLTEMSIYERENIDRAYQAAEALLAEAERQFPNYVQEAGDLAQDLFEALDGGATRDDLLDIIEGYGAESWMPRGFYKSWLPGILSVGTGY